MCSVKILPSERVGDVHLPTPQVTKLHQELQVARVPNMWLRSTASLEGTTVKQSPFSPARAKVDKVIEIEKDSQNSWEFVIAALAVIPPAAWASTFGLLDFTGILALASAHNCACFLAQEYPFFGSTTIADYMALEELRKQHEGSSQPPTLSHESQKSPSWFEIEGAHAYMFPEKDIFYWTIRDHPDVGLLSGQIGRCIGILHNDMLLLRFNKLSPKISTPILPNKERLHKENLMEVAKWSDFLAIDKRITGELLRLFPPLGELSA